jgi:D-arginine dehydrogenase
MQSYDIAIIGGGIAGLSLAHFLAGRRSVVVLEQESAIGYHSTGRSAAEFVLRYNSPEVCALATIARRFFETPPEGFASVPLLRQRGGITIACADKAGRLQTQFEAERNHAPLVPLTADEAIAQVPFLDPAYVAAAYYDPEFWDIEVESLLQGYVRGARRTGADIRTGAVVTAIRDDGRQWLVETSGGPVTARTIVNAAGGWADHLATLAGVTPHCPASPHRRAGRCARHRHL